MNLPAKAWRRAVACMLAAAMSVTAVPATADSRTDRDRLILLGTKGGPSVRDVDQVPTSNAVVLGKDTYLVDAGYGAALRLVEARIPLTSVRAILLTHHHSDHNLDVGPLIYSAWTGGLAKPVGVYGPRGVENLVAGYLQSNAFDMTTRMQDEGRPDLRRLIDVKTYSEGPVMENERIKVTALKVAHPPIDDSYALKIEVKGGKTIVFSGDTTYFPPLAAFARNADYLVHEVMYVPALERLTQRSPNAKTLMKHLLASHTTTEDVGRIAAAAGVKNVVLTHFVPGADPAMHDEQWLEGVRKHYGGNVVLGRDRLEIPLD